MKREIIFRSVHYKHSGEFSHFSYWGCIDHKGEPSDDCFASPSSSSTTYRKTEEQYTGLTDKNGVKIFEGDVLKSTFKSLDGTESEIIGTVEDDACNPCFVIHYKYNGNGHDCYEYDFVQCGLRVNEVIGNIHTTPAPHKN